MKLVPDFPDDDNEAGGSLGKESGSAPQTGASAEVTAVDGAEEDDGFETVDDGNQKPGNKVVISIPVKKVVEPEDSGLAGKSLMFESEEEDDPELKKQIEAALDKTDLLGELMLSEHESESESSDDDDHNEDLNETKQYYEDQEEGIEESGSKPISPKTVNTDPAAVLESAGNPTDSKPDCPIRKNPAGQTRIHQGQGCQQRVFWQSSCSQTTTFGRAAQGVQEHAQSTLFDAAALAQATSMEEDTTRHLENYTGLLTGLQKLVVTMASGYEAATEDFRSLVASTLDVATQ